MLLLDEIEKAHDDIYHSLLPIMDYATLTDTQGRKADFRHCIIIMTSNAGATAHEQMVIGFNESTNLREKAFTKALKETFQPEFRNRLDTVLVFNTINKQIASLILQNYILEFKELLYKNKQIIFDASGDVWEMILKKEFQEFGARELARVFQKKIKEKVAKIIIRETHEKEKAKQLTIFAIRENNEIIFHSSNFCMVTNESSHSDFLKTCQEAKYFALPPGHISTTTFSSTTHLRTFSISAKSMLAAYFMGYFVMTDSEFIISKDRLVSKKSYFWYNQDESFVITPNSLHISKSLKKTLKQQPFQITVNQAFKEVVQACGKLEYREEKGTWLDDSLIDVYLELHKMGFAVSVEA